MIKTYLEPTDAIISSSLHGVQLANETSQRMKSNGAAGCLICARR